MAVRIKWKRTPNPFQQIRELPAVAALVYQSAKDIEAGCGDGYEAKQGDGATRARAAVVTTTMAAIVDNATNNTLLANLDRGRV